MTTPFPVPEQQDLSGSSCTLRSSGAPCCFPATATSAGDTAFLFLQLSKVAQGHLPLSYQFL